MSEFLINDFLKKAVEKGVSDIHLKMGHPPACRFSGKIYPVKMPDLTEEDFVEILNTIVPQGVRNKVFTNYELDFSYEIPGVSRFRVNLSRELGKLFFVIRVIPYEIPTLEQLNLPDSLYKFSKLNNGIVLVTGPTGSGKSSTLAALINDINKTAHKHIITIEDPVEFVFEPKHSIITQRQVGSDTSSFTDGLKYAMRQDPDVILIGEIRDRETVSAALKAAETGHLVFATMHTNDAIHTINRIIGFFDPNDRESVKHQIAQTLKGTVSQRLVPTKDGKGRIPANDILFVTTTVQDFINKDKFEGIYELMSNNSYEGSQTMNLSLFNLYEKGIITKEAALETSDNKNELELMMKGVFRSASGV